MKAAHKTGRSNVSGAVLFGAAILLVTGILSATFAPAMAEEPFVFTLLPADNNCLSTVEVVDPPLTCLKAELPNNPQVGRCLGRDAHLTIGKYVVCWMPAKRAFNRFVHSYNFTDNDIRAFASCRNRGDSVMRSASGLSCVATPAEIRKLAFEGHPTGGSPDEECPPNCLRANHVHESSFPGRDVRKSGPRMNDRTGGPQQH